MSAKASLGNKRTAAYKTGSPQHARRAVPSSPGRFTSSTNYQPPRHKTSYSYGESISSKLQTLLEAQERRSGAPAVGNPFDNKARTPNQRTTPLNARNNQRKSNPRPSTHKAYVHKRTASGTTKSVDPEITHKRKYSLDAEQRSKIRFAYNTNVGYMPGNPGKVNQDSYIIWPNMRKNPEVYFFSVCDGHGYYGEKVSGFVKQRYPAILENEHTLLTNNKVAITSAVTKVASELGMVNFDINFSGTTMIQVLMEGNKLWCGNIGDSRALMARLLSDGPSERNPGRHWMSIALSRDHKPDERDEAMRIFQNGGRVESYQDEEGNPLGPARVWLKNENIPGLAMSRSLGDLVAASVGCIFEPEILEYGITPDDKFIVLGSDGIFEFLSNEDVVRIVVPYWKSGDIQGACDALAKEARDRWIKEEEVIDDITCVIVFLQPS